MKTYNIYGISVPIDVKYIKCLNYLGARYSNWLTNWNANPEVTSSNSVLINEFCFQFLLFGFN